MKKLIGLLATSSLFMLAACSDDEGSSPATPVSSITPEFCQANNMSYTVTPNGDGICVAAALSSSSIDPYAGLLQSSSSMDALPVASSSSEAAPVAASSSSVAPAPASSTPAPASSAPAEETSDGLFHLALWDGTAGDGQVPTGNRTGGYWYSYTDKGDKGLSTITWGAEVGSEYSADDLVPVITACGGLCGSFNLVVGDNPYKPYIGIGFNYSKSSTEGADATAAKGVCVVYTSSIDINLEMGLGAQDAKIGYANPFVTLPASTAAKTADFAWSEFEQPSWAETTVSNPEKALVSLKFKFAGTTDGEDGGEGTFNIMKVGAAGQCN